MMTMNNNSNNDDDIRINNGNSNNNKRLSYVAPAIRVSISQGCLSNIDVLIAYDQDEWVKPNCFPMKFDFDLELSTMDTSYDQKITIFLPLSIQPNYKIIFTA